MLQYLSKRTSLIAVLLTALFPIIGTTQLSAGDDDKVQIVINPVRPKTISSHASPEEKERFATMEARRAARKPDPLISKYAAKPFSKYRVSGAELACFYISVQEPRKSLISRIIHALQSSEPVKKEPILKVIGKMSSYNKFRQDNLRLPETQRAIKFIETYLSDPLGEAELAVMKAILDGDKNVFVWKCHDQELPVMLYTYHITNEDADNFHIYHTPGHFSFLASPVDKDYIRQRALGQLIEEAYLKPEKIISKEKINQRMVALGKLKPRVQKTLTADPRIGDQPTVSPKYISTSFKEVACGIRKIQPPTSMSDFSSAGGRDLLKPAHDPQTPLHAGVDEALRENIAHSVFKLNYEFESILGNPPAPKGYQFVADPEQKARKHGPKVVAQKYPGRVAITGDGYVLYSQLPAAEMKKLHDQKFRFEVEMKSTTPGAYVQYWGFKKGSEKLKSAPHIGDGKWLTLSIDFTIDKEATQYLIYPAIMPAVPSNSEAPVVKVRNVRITQL
ncbi:MAG: hypothetical protein K2P93_01070 [Alphaproteobacteria bacterium]|nr:hypothetical protein [Alphaproteobacteria bacterium]